MKTYAINRQNSVSSLRAQSSSPDVFFLFFRGGLGMGGWSETSSYNQLCLCSSLPSISIPSSAVQASHTPTHHLTVNTATCYLFLHSHRATALKKTGSLFHGSQTQTELQGRREFDMFFFFFFLNTFSIKHFSLNNLLKKKVNTISNGIHVLTL